MLQAQLLLLIVLNRVGIGTASPSNTLEIAGSGTPININSTNDEVKKIQFENSGVIQGYYGCSSGTPMRILNGSSTELMRIDSSGRLNIGTTTSISGSLLNINGGFINANVTDNSHKFIRSTTGTTGLNDPLLCKVKTTGDMVDGLASLITFSVEDSSGVNNNLGFIGATRSGADNSGSLIFHTFNSGSQAERMRIDSSGNVFIGKTSSSDAAGIELLQNGTIDLQASNSLLAYFNRTGSDGTIVEFHRSGVVKGLISSRSGFIDIGNDNAGLRFEGSNNAINPRNPTTGDNSDNSLDLGKSASRFKDLYLGGGLYVGGTGTANKLDDYEEGTWTPTLVGATTAGTYGYDTTRTGGKYIKIGDTVFLTGVFRVNSVTAAGTGAATIGGVPFTIGSNTGASSYSRTGGVLLKQGGFSGSTSIFIAANPGTVLNMFQQDATTIADLAVTDVDDLFGIYSFQILIKI
jgi:hypothetical protein